MMYLRFLPNFLSFIHVCCVLEMADFTVSEVHLVSKDQVYRLERGSDVTLGCEFITSRFNLFDNPILWRKMQLDEDCQLNMMSNVLEPFRSRGRFKVAFSSNANKHKFNLSISGVSYEDVGNYTCEVNGPQNTLLGSVTYTVYVKAPLEILSLNNIDDFGPFEDLSPEEGQASHQSNVPKHKLFNLTLEEESYLVQPGGSSLLLQDPSKRKTTYNKYNFQKISPPTKSQLIFGNDIPKFDLNTEESMTFETSHVDGNVIPLAGVDMTVEDQKHSIYNSSYSNSRVDFESPSANYIPSYKQPSLNSREANYTENKPGRLSCVAGGLYPPTSLTLLIGSRNITSSLRYCLRAYPGKGIKGLRLIHFEVARWTEKLWATPEDDGQYLQCNAAFNGSPLVNNFTCVRMVVNYAPRVACPGVPALLNQLEAKLSCRISSQPGVASINWLSPRSGSSVNSSTIQQTMESSEYTLQNRIVDGVIETSLIIRRVQERHFGVYNITAENGLEIGWGTADLRKRETHLSPKSWAFVEHSSNQALKRGVGSHYYHKSSHGQHSTLTPTALGYMTMTMIILCVPLPVIFWSSS